ncbi:MAG: hypothetical protein CSA65_04495 [Proteobacteria bacterium]|nr:MAG: hypothetical protein CSB49_07780 [Pseudomonadota bacterium]PIE18549.1 MAG: hypothetical protein CSA65_04495 [Pseudomonadota bacterium]
MTRVFGWSLALALLLSVVVADDAQGQGFAPRPRPGPRPSAQKPEKKGPAEASPEGKDSAEADLPALPSWPGAQKKKLLFFQLDGYFRFRSDLMHNFNLGQTTLVDRGVRAPYWVPLVESSSTLKCSKRVGLSVPGGGERGIEADDCPDNTLAGANIRLRLEPTINVAEKVRVKAQLDIFDNLVMGSTPDSIMGQSLSPHLPTALFSESQEAPIVGRNSNTPSILVKRAWAEIDTPLGELKVGRMPWHWGMGIMANSGACWDCNYGDNVDRLQFTVDWAKHSFGIAYDFAGSGPDSYKIDLSSGLAGSQTFVGGGQAVDLEQLDDVDQLVLFAGRFDRPEVIKDRLDRGEIVLNYGGLFVWRKQMMDYVVAGKGDSAIISGLNASESDLASTMREISAYVLTTDLWFKLMWKRLYVEFEGLAVFGEIGNASKVEEGEDPVDILQWGFVLRSRYGFLRNAALKVGLEFGFASGNDAELFDLNRRRGVYRPGAPPRRINDLREYRFDPDFIVDLILFREIMGTVANAMYFKPSIQYDIFDSLGARLDIIYSLAHRTVAYPGNSRNLGLEFDLDIYYKNVDEGFYVGFQYGLLIPFAGLDRPGEIFGTDAQSAQVAQTLQLRCIVKF